MTNEYDGRIDNIDMPCPANLEIQFSVITEDHHWDRHEYEAAYESGHKMHLAFDIYEKYIGDGEHSDVPIIKYSSKQHAPAYCGSLLLRPVNYYRALPSESRGVGDALEGCREPHEMGIGSEMTITSLEDGTSMRLDASGAKKIDSCHKTLMYCCSLYDGNQVLTRESARDIFREDYTHGSIFPSSKKLVGRLRRMPSQPKAIRMEMLMCG